MHKIERKIKIIVNCKTRYNAPSPGGRELEGGGNLAEFTLTLPHPNPLHQVEREFPSRERILCEINYMEDYIQPRMRKEVREWR
jgi:hypothetical protein